ncbi:MAG: sugar phosphate isomerase/epimerase [Puniceicoccales bacterium]|nr:sugar phosphate isomerase/epimerase [Puniceicoccales bacterium]
MKRRDFFSLSAAAGTVAAIGGTQRLLAADDAASGTTKAVPIPAEPAQLNLCLQWGTIPGGSATEKLDFLEGNGFSAVELPTGNWLLGKPAKEFQTAMQGRKLTVATACGPSDFSYADKARRDKEVEKFLPQLEVLGALKSVGLILCPARGSVPIGGGNFQTLRDDFVNNTGKRLAAHAAKHGTNIVLEPLRRQETPYLRLVADGAAIARDLGPGAKVMGDFWHMNTEETSFLGAFVSGGKWLAHVHIASLGRRSVPGTEPKVDKYTDGFRGLKLIGYRGAVSFEGGIPKRNASREDVKKFLLDMAKYIRAQWAEA